MATEVKNKWAFTTEPFGEPTLYASRNSSACWVRTPPATVYQKSPTQWAANLYGGIQTNDDWASIIIPVNELPTDHLAKAMWTYYMDAAESGGVNIVIWLHDPTDFSKRIEVTQAMDEAGRAAGFNKENLEMSTAELFFFGEDTTGTELTKGTSSYSSWKQFREDALFKDWTIYRISLDYGWLPSSTLDEVWVTEIKINDTIIPLKPDSTGTGRVGRRFFTAGTEIAVTSATLAPQTPFRLLDVKLHLNAAATKQTFTLACDADRGSAYDTLLYSKAMAGVQDIIVPFGIGYDFYEDDEIDAKWVNDDGKTYGITYSYQTVFEGC